MRRMNILGLFSILLCSCDPYYFLVIENRSSHNILAYWATDYAHPEQCSVYPDTLLPDKYFYHSYYNGYADSIDSYIIPLGILFRLKQFLPSNTIGVLINSINNFISIFLITSSRLFKQVQIAPLTP